MATVENQTLFAEEQPFFDPDKFGNEMVEKSSPKNSKKTVLIAITIALILLVVVGLTLLRVLPKQQGDIQNNVTPSPTTQTNLSALDLQFQELADDLKIADPSTNILPFPPVKEEITVSPDTK